MPEPTLATLFTNADPTRTAIVEPVAPQVIAAAVDARLAAEVATGPGPRRAHFRGRCSSDWPVAAVAVVLAGKVIALSTAHDPAPAPRR